MAKVISSVNLVKLIQSFFLASSTISLNYSSKTSRPSPSLALIATMGACTCFLRVSSLSSKFEYLRSLLFSAIKEGF
jgi:hypothetical protein